MDKIKEMKKINKQLKEACRVYYNEGNEIMTNKEYDALYDYLLDLERQTGVVLNDSISNQVGFEVVSKLQKDTHEEKALSLDKTKDREQLKDWLGTNEGILSWKLDGLTVVLTYDNGKLTKAVTRGNGKIGEIVTHNAKHFVGIPQKIDYLGHMVVRGEALMTYSEFEKVNSQIENVESKYKNPRNLASGTVRQLDSYQLKKKRINFQAFELVTQSDQDIKLHSERLQYLKTLGFDVVSFVKVNADNLLSTMDEFESKITKNDFPSDGLVLLLNDVAYGKSLGTTGKFPRNGIAFKWADEVAETTVVDIEWNASRTGLINPIAVFEPIELEGTTVKRASVHNVSILKQLNLSVGSVITVYKANMIIPTIDQNIKPNGNVVIPKYCPVCHELTKVEKSKDNIETLICPNPKCSAKNIKAFTHFVSREAMNIDGLSEATLEKFVDRGFIHSFLDLYDLDRYQSEIIEMDGFGEKSYRNIIRAIEKSKNVRFENFLYALGIHNVGKDVAKRISNYCKGDWNCFINLLKNGFDFQLIDGIGVTIQINIYDWFENKNNTMIEKLTSLLHFEPFHQEKEDSSITDKTFVITGSLFHFSNRNSLKEFIESKGGKVSSSVSSKTDYLINNDILSNSSKNKKAKELNITILTEQDFLKLL